MAHAARAFAAIAREHAERPALVWGPTSYTPFATLDRQANQVARLLLQHGVRRHDTVCLQLEKCVLAYSALLACLKIGVPYFFVDPANPPARTRTMIARCRPAVALTAPGVPVDELGCPALVTAGAVDADPLLAGIDDAPVEAPWPVGGDDAAYVMFTSGSTGEPKGVTISHDNLRHFMAWTRAELGTSPADIFTNVNPLFFDNSVFDVFGSIFAGAALAPIAPAMLKQPAGMLRHLEAIGGTVFFSVPSLLVYLQTLKLVDDTAFPTFRAILFGGEGYPKPMLAKLHRSVGARVALINVYGPTECTCIASAYRISAEDFADPAGLAPLGRLLPGFSYLLVDESGSPVSTGETGELWLGGPQVGLGYFNDPEQTRRAFVPDPLSDSGSERMYRTGDLVREDAAGRLHFVGRADTQIKHQGYRIELGEIEHALAAIDGVDEAAAVHLTGGRASRIVAAVASRAALAPAEVKARLSAAIPAYMLPERIIVMRALPKNANGKIDRQALRGAAERGELS